MLTRRCLIKRSIIFIKTPLLHIACHIMQAVSVRWIVTDRLCRSRGPSIVRGVGGSCIAPRIFNTGQSTARRFLPFRFRWQTFANPSGVCQCCIPTHIPHRMEFFAGRIRICSPMCEVIAIVEIVREVGFAENRVSINKFFIVGIGYFILVNIEVIKVNRVHWLFIFYNGAAHLEFARGDTEHAIRGVWIGR